MMNRRHFLQIAAAFPFAARALAFDNGKQAQWVFLGTDKGAGISRARWNAATGELGEIELAIAADRPDFFALHPTLPLLYSVNSVGKGQGAVSSFRFDRKSAELQLLHKTSSHGDGPCFVSVDRTGRVAFVANYPGGSFAAYFLDDTGQMIDAGSFSCVSDESCGALGPVTDRQESSHLHCATISPKNDFVLVCDLGKDSIEVVGFEARSRGAILLGRTRVACRPGSGPRHVAFHPNGKWLYCIHEVDCTIDLYDWSVAGGKPSATLRENSVLSTLAPGVPLKGNTACELLISPDGRFAYACTRGADDITVYRIDQSTGLLTEQQRVSCGGQVPRILAFDPTHRWLISCNQQAPGSVTIFAHDPAKGRLSAKPVHTYAAETPMFISWI